MTLATATPLDVLREHRSDWRGRHERRRQSSQFELRAKPNGTGGTAYCFNGYAAVFDSPFEMWDAWGDPYFEVLAAGSCTRTLNGGADVQFLIGHNEASIPLARTKSGTMSLSADDHGLYVDVPSLDGRSPIVQSLASAMERGDMDEMSIGFIATQQMWSPDWMQRTISEINLHRGDVSVVCWAANPAAAGALMTALPVSEAVSRPAPPAREERASTDMGVTGDPENGYSDQDAPDYNPAEHGPGSPVCPGCGAANGLDARFCDQCGAGLYDNDALIEDPLMFARQARVRVLALKR